MRHRPLFVPAVAMGTGIGLAQSWGVSRLDAPWVQWVVLVLALVSTGVYLLSRRFEGVGALATLGLVALVAGVGVLRYSQQRLPMSIYHQKAEFTEQLQGVIVSFPTGNDGQTRFVLQPDYDAGWVQVFYTHRDHVPVTLRYGDRVRLKGSFEAPQPFLGFDYPEYLANRGIWGIARVWQAAHIERLEGGQGHPVLRWAAGARDALFKRVDRFVPEPHADTFKALAFGQRTLLDAEVAENFRNAGVAHVLAVSGLHLGIVLALLWGVLRGLGLGPTATYLIIAGLVAAYLVLVGFKASLVRAALLFAFLALGHVLKARSWVISAQIDPLQGWAAAALLVLFADPQALFDVGFQLSFAATGAILLVTPLLPALWACLRLSPNVGPARFRRWHTTVQRVLVTALMVSVSAQLGVAPLLALHFHTLQLGTALSNLWAVPGVTLILWVGTIGLIVFFLPFVPLSQAIGQGLWWLLAALNAGVSWLAGIPGMTVDVPNFPIVWLAGYYPVFIAGALWAQQRFVQPSSARKAASSASLKS